MKTAYKYLHLVVLITLINACTNEDYKVYNIGQKDSVFFEYYDDKEEVVDSLSYVFNYDIATVHTISIPISLMGMPIDQDRVISITPVDSLTDMKEGIHYTIENLTMPANAVKTEILVHLLRDKDPELQTRSFTLKLELTENDDLSSLGRKFFTITYSDIRPTERPGWWPTYASLPVYSFESAQLFFKYFYELAPIANKDVFDEMIFIYGDYFVKAGSMQGPYSMYTNYLIKHVLMPMYEDTKDSMEWQSIPSL